MQQNRYLQFAEPIDHYILENGHEVFYVHRPNCGVAKVAVIVPHGSSNDIAPGATHFYEHLTQHYSQKHPESRLRFIEERYGIIFAGALTSWSHLETHATSVKEAATLLVSAQIEGLFHPVITDDGLESERGAILSELRLQQQRNDYLTAYYAALGINDKHALAFTIGDQSSIKAISRDLINRTRQEILRQKCFILIIGEADIDSVIAACDGLSAQPMDMPREKFIDTFDTGIKNLRHERITDIACEWIFPFIEDRRKRITFGLLCQLLTSTRCGLLMNELRIKRGLVYDVKIEDYPVAFRCHTLSIQGLKDTDTRDQTIDITEQYLDIDQITKHVTKYFASEKRLEKLYRLNEKMHEYLSLSDLIKIVRHSAFDQAPFDEVYDGITAHDVVEVAAEALEPSRWARILLDPA